MTPMTQPRPGRHRPGGAPAPRPAVAWPLPGPLVPVRFVRRLNRFAVEVEPLSSAPWPAGDREAGRAGGPAGRAGPGADGRSGDPVACPEGAKTGTRVNERESGGLPAPREPGRSEASPHSRDAGAGGPRAPRSRGTGPGAVPARLRLHLPNSGRMEELLVPGALGLARPRPEGEPRKTAGELILIRHAGRWVSVDARLPNELMAACLAAGALSPFAGYATWQREVRWGQGRIDFRLHRPGEGRGCLVETKSCNRVEGGVALFPDAPTARGARHLHELRAAVAQGWRAAVVWFVQRDDARELRPDARSDPAFARALAAAVAAGVEAYAYRCRVTPRRILVLDPIPVVLPAVDAGDTPEGEGAQGRL